MFYQHYSKIFDAFTKYPLLSNYLQNQHFLNRFICFSFYLNVFRRLFSHLTQLEYLDLSHNNIVFISGKQFFHLKSIETIDLSHNQLLSLALDPLLSDLDYSVFYKCTTLKYLYIQNNSLIEIYEDWRLQLTNLKMLNLANNNITDIQVNNIASLRVRIHTSCHCCNWPQEFPF